MRLTGVDPDVGSSPVSARRLFGHRWIANLWTATAVVRMLSVGCAGDVPRNPRPRELLAHGGAPTGQRDELPVSRVVRVCTAA
jgi:hypothetical protein